MQLVGVFLIVCFGVIYAQHAPIVRPGGGYLDVGGNFKDLARNSPNHLDGSIYGKVPLHKGLPVGVGGGLQYQNDHGHGAYMNVDHIPRINTRVDVGGTYRVHDGPKSSVDLYGGGHKNFGPHGNPWGVQGGVRVNF